MVDKKHIIYKQLKVNEFANKQLEQNQSLKSTEDLTNRVKELAKSFKQNPEQITEVLKFHSRFYQYSVRNNMLIYSQNPGATFTDSYKGFQKQGYNVKKGEHGMKILVPVKATYLKDGKDWVQLFKANNELKQAYKENKIETKTVQRFKVGTVFDISQTDCPVEDYPKFYHMGYKSTEHRIIYEGIKKFSEDYLHCPLEDLDMKSISKRGAYYPGLNEITINEKLLDTEKLSTAIHEVSHAVLHNDIDNVAPSCQKEFEADALSVMLEDRLGIEISELRQKHLSDNYKFFEDYIDKQSFEKAETDKTISKDKIPSVNSSLEKVVGKYKEIIEPFQNTIDAAIAHSAVQASEMNLTDSIPEEFISEDFMNFEMEMM